VGAAGCGDWIYQQCRGLYRSNPGCFQPHHTHLLKPLGRNGQVVAAWSFAALGHFGLYFFLRRYPVLSPVFLSAGILLALPTLLIIVLGWYL